MIHHLDRRVLLVGSLMRIRWSGKDGCPQTWLRACQQQAGVRDTTLTQAYWNVYQCFKGLCNTNIIGNTCSVKIIPLNRKEERWSEVSRLPRLAKVVLTMYVELPAGKVSLSVYHASMARVCSRYNHLMGKLKLLHTTIYQFFLISEDHKTILVNCASLVQLASP